MGVFLYLASLLLSLTLTSTVGLSPLHTSAKLTLSPDFISGTVCLIWDSPDDRATPGSDCWTVENSRQRTWVKPMVLRTGSYGVWVTEVGQDAQGHAWSKRTPERRVEVY